MSGLSPARPIGQTARAKMLTLPNILTLSRIFAVPILVFLLWRPEPWHSALAFGLYVLMGVTDYFDGYLARAQGAVSKLGIFLDPIADKIMVAAVIVMLVAMPGAKDSEPPIAGWNVVAALVILLREIAVSGLREFLADLRVSVPVSKLAKWKTAFQLISLGAIILAGAFVHDPRGWWVEIWWIGIVTLWLAAALTLVTGWDYLRVGLKHMD